MAYPSAGEMLKRGPARFCISTVFFIYINDIDTNLFSKICNFADDTKIGRAVATEDEVQILRDDLKN